MILVTWVEKEPKDGARILKAFFDTWFDAHPAQHPFERDVINELDMCSLRQIAEKSPTAFISGMLDALLRSVDAINRRKLGGEPDDPFTYRTLSGYRYGADEFLGLFRSALRQVATADESLARSFMSRLDASKHEALLHLHLEMLSANPEAFSRHLLELLGNKFLFNAGWDGAKWKSFADAARTAFPYLRNEDRRLVETVISSHYPEIGRAIRLAHEIRENGETEPWFNRRSVVWDLNHSGFVQWCILEAIGENLLSDAGIQNLKGLRRKFPGQKVPEPGDLGVYDAGSPIKREKAARMSDSNWLRAIIRYNSENERRRGPGFIDGAARQLARELQHATKENPSRFGALMKHISKDANPTYVFHVMWGLIEAEAIEDEVLEVLKEAILEAHSYPNRPYGCEIVRLFEKSPKIAKDSFLFDVLAWYLENGAANEATQSMRPTPNAKPYR